jgi:hypothetical protein
LDEFMQIDSLDDDLSYFVDFAFDEVGPDYTDYTYGNLDGDDYVSPDELFYFILDVMHGFSYGAEGDSGTNLDSIGPVPILTRGQALLAVMKTDRDSIGKLSMAEMQTIVDEIYLQDDTMPPELSTA